MLRPERRALRTETNCSARSESFGNSILEGWKFSWRNYEVRVGLLVVSAAMFLLIPFTTLLPVFARDILQVGARGQGILLTCMGIGALFSSLLVAFSATPAARPFHHRRRSLVRRPVGDFFGFFFVWFVDGFDVHDRALPCDLPCADPNCHTVLFSCGISRPDYGAFPHDPSDSRGRCNVDR
jgi:hypothetical protein